MTLHLETMPRRPGPRAYARAVRRLVLAVLLLTAVLVASLVVFDAERLSNHPDLCPGGCASVTSPVDGSTGRP